MTSSDEAQALLSRVTTLLTEEHLQQRIDDPITIARDSFECLQIPEYSEKEFHSLIANFWRHMWRQTVGQDPGLTVALGEAIALLEAGYRGTHSDGYDGALTDALNPGTGHQVVVHRIAELFRTRRRAIFTQWVFDRYVISTDWEVRCAMVALLLDRHREELPEQLQQIPRERLADHIPDLFRTLQEVARRILSDWAVPF